MDPHMYINNKTKFRTTDTTTNIANAHAARFVISKNIYVIETTTTTNYDWVMRNETNVERKKIQGPKNAQKITISIIDYW